MPADKNGQKTVLLGITGCIAAYKACEICRGLQKAGVRVKVVMTQNATQFVGVATFRALTREPVAVGLFDQAADPIHHISLAEECDLFLIAPATANVLAKLAQGVADDLLTTTALATEAPLMVAPAMNVHMYENEITQTNMETLRARGYRFVDPVEGHLACGYDGAGKLAEVDVIVAAALEALKTTDELAGKRVLITAGPTHEPIDPVRFIGNRSTGKMGFALAKECARRGARVTVVAGPTTARPPFGCDVIPVQTAQEMLAAAESCLDDANLVICAAAVADYRPAQTAGHKLKKGVDDLTRIDLIENPDILKTLAEKSASQGSDRIIVGFAAETNDVIANAQRKLERKGAHLIVANDVSRADSTFGSNTNRVSLVSTKGVKTHETLPKSQVAAVIVDEVVELMR